VKENAHQAQPKHNPVVFGEAKQGYVPLPVHGVRGVGVVGVNALQEKLKHKIVVIVELNQDPAILPVPGMIGVNAQIKGATVTIAQ